MWVCEGLCESVRVCRSLQGSVRVSEGLCASVRVHVSLREIVTGFDVRCCLSSDGCIQAPPVSLGMIRSGRM